MARYTPTGSLNSVLAINAELEKISQAFEDTVSRKGDSPNQLEGDLDLNGNSLLNVQSNPNNPNSVVSRNEVYTKGETDVLLEENRNYTDQREANIRADFSEGIIGATFVVVVYPDVASLEASEPTQTGQRAEVVERANAQYVLAAAGYVAQAGDITAANGRVWELQIDGEILAEWFGAVGDGVTDDASSLQTILDLGYVARLQQKKTYAISSDLQWRRGGGFYSDCADWYPDTVQNGGREFKGARIKWIGASTTGAMLRMSATAIGVEQTSAFDDSVFGAVLRGIVIDGNDLVDYGLYSYRAFGADIQNIIATRTNKHGVYGTALYSGVWNKVMAWKNNGAGLTFGRGQVDFGFSIAQLNAVTLTDIWGFANGYNGLFDETTNPAEGYGVGIWSHRGNFISGIRAENNDGANFYWCPTSYSNDVQHVYTELGNSLDIGVGATAITQGRASQKISTIIEGYTGGVSYGNKLTYLSCSSEIIKLIGVNPSAARYGERVVIEGVSGGNGVDAAWSSYRLVDCNREMFDNVTGSQPDPATSTVNGYVVPDSQMAGYVTFTESGGTVTLLDSYNVTSVTGSAGTYNVNWDRDLQNADYTVTTSFGDNRVVGVVTRSTTLTSIRHRTLTGTLTSATTAITVVAYGRVVQ